jgi:hypothetical protein
MYLTGVNSNRATFHGERQRREKYRDQLNQSCDFVALTNVRIALVVAVRVGAICDSDSTHVSKRDQCRWERVRLRMGPTYAYRKQQRRGGARSGRGGGR